MPGEFNPMDSFARRLTSEAGKAAQAAQGGDADSAAEAVDPMDSFSLRLEHEVQKSDPPARPAQPAVPAFERELSAHGFMMPYCKKALADVGEADLGRQIQGKGHSPRWIVGHLAVSADYGLRMLGKPMACGESWHKAFGMGSREDGEGPSPSGLELLGAVELGYERLVAAARSAAAEVLARPIDFPIFRGTPIRTVGDAVAHLLTTHLGFHLGQLSAWRRQVGFAPMF